MERRQFQTEMEVSGRMSIADGDEWLNARLKSVSNDDLANTLGKIKSDQSTFLFSDCHSVDLPELFLEEKEINLFRAERCN